MTVLSIIIIIVLSLLVIFLSFAVGYFVGKQETPKIALGILERISIPEEEDDKESEGEIESESEDEQS